MSLVTVIFSELTILISRAITGRLFTSEQIKNISSHSVGRYFTDLFPEDKDSIHRRERMELAQAHIEDASSIISEMKVDLDAQKQTLATLVEEIEEKRSTAQKYAELALTNQNAVSAIRNELEIALREELTRQSEKGRFVRRVTSISLWVITLIIGAALGTYFKNIIALIASLGA